MSKKKGKDKKKKEKKYKSAVEERVKLIGNIKAPDEEPFKKENELAFENFAKFGRLRVTKLLNKKVEERMKKIMRGRVKKY